MNAHVVLAGCALLAATMVAAAQHDPAQSSGIGQKVDNVKFTGLDGKSFALHDLQDKKAIVILFLTFECPVSNSYLAELTELARTCKDTAFVGVCTSAEEPAQLGRQMQEFQVGFPLVQDVRHRIVDVLKARVTPEVFVLDGQFVLRYRGRVDDAWAARLKRNKEVSRHDLREALAEVRAGKTVTRPVTQAVGCPIASAEARPAEPRAARTKLTYTKDVLPILQKHCQVCHRPGEMGPFALMTYAQAVNWAPDIKEYTQKRIMPPWKPSVSVPLHGERRMTDAEITTLTAWVNGGTPRGDPNDAPPPVKFADGWMLGTPDLILSPKEEFTLGPTGSDHYRVYVFPLDLAEDKFISGYEVRPGNWQAVHHTLHFLDVRGRVRKLEQREQDRPRRGDAQDAGPGYPSRMGPGFLPDGDCGGWAPGITPHFLPEGVGYYVPKGADFVAHVHYHRTGKVEKDKLQIGLYFSRKPCKPLQPMIIGGLFLSVPPNEENYRVRGSIWAAQDCTLYTVVPHMHLLGKKIKITMTPPDGPTTTLVSIDDWDFNWQEIYYLKEPLKVAARTRFDVEGVFDNSSKNPNNPFSPPRRVLVGESTTNEMCFGFLGATIAEPGPIGWQLWPGGLTMRRLGVLPK